jgi:hypothetical protein
MCFEDALELAVESRHLFVDVGRLALDGEAFLLVEPCPTYEPERPNVGNALEQQRIGIRMCGVNP